MTQKELAEVKIITGNLSTVLAGNLIFLDLSSKHFLMNNKKIIAETVIKLGKTDIELNNVKNDLTNAKIDLASKLEGTILNYF